MPTKPISKRTKIVVKQWEIEGFKEQLRKLKQKVEYLEETSCVPKITIFSAGADACIGMYAPAWHKIVCLYEGDKCLGGQRPHWRSSWAIDDKGFHLESMVDQDFKGWRGQYRESNELKYDQLPQAVLHVHHQTLCEHIKRIGIYYPCHIYNDFTGEMYRP